MMAGEPYSTMIWVSRIQGLKSHLRIIARDCEGSDDRHVLRLGRQAQAGVEEADRYLADQRWPAEDEVAA
jgi:hypothetical protein